MFSYKKALCRKIPKSIVNDGIRIEENLEPLDYDLAVEQWLTMVNALKSLGLTVTILEADESTPDCVFVEDPAVVIGATALITNPGAASRKKEAIAIKEYFEQNEKHLNIIEMQAPAELDGGDVMFTGHEIFVGLSSRTNQEGIEVLRKAFPDYPVHSIVINNSTLHLKSMMTMADENIIICGQSPDACEAIKKVQEKATRVYSIMRTPDDKGANVVIVNKTILCRSKSDYPQSYTEIDKLSISKIELNATELSKVDGCLTCCSLLYN